MTLHIAFVHSFVNPLLFLVLHRNTRAATCSLLLCSPEEEAVTPHPAGGKYIKVYLFEMVKAGILDFYYCTI